MSLSFLQSLLLEKRDKKLKYDNVYVKNEISRVVVELKGKKSEEFTKLATRFDEVKTEIDSLKTQFDAINAELTEKVEELYDVEDMIYTRVVQTVSATITLSKKVAPEEKPVVDYEAVIKKLNEMLPDLSDKIAEVVKDCTKMSKSNGKKPGIRVDMNEGISDFISKIKGFFGNLVEYVSDWARGYDRDLKELDRMVKAL